MDSPQSGHFWKKSLYTKHFRFRWSISLKLAEQFFFHEKKSKWQLSSTKIGTIFCVHGSADNSEYIKDEPKTFGRYIVWVPSWLPNFVLRSKMYRVVKYGQLMISAIFNYFFPGFLIKKEYEDPWWPNKKIRQPASYMLNISWRFEVKRSNTAEIICRPRMHHSKNHLKSAKFRKYILHESDSWTSHQCFLHVRTNSCAIL